MPHAKSPREAFGQTWMAAPSSWFRDERSKSWTLWPARRQEIAAEKPAIPAPTMRMFNGFDSVDMVVMNVGIGRWEAKSLVAEDVHTLHCLDSAGSIRRDEAKTYKDIDKDI